MSCHEFEQKMNEWARNGVPFLFIVDFEMKNPLIFRLADIDPKEILYQVGPHTNALQIETSAQPQINVEPVATDEYESKFNKVYEHLSRGDSYLTNLTVRTKISTTAALRELFAVSRAPYRLLFHDTFLVFSPEIFVRIDGNTISAYPMKGTISASIPGAARILDADPKELAEHVTIVDLIRNDLSTVAENVTVRRFRYQDLIHTSRGPLLQVSSEITGRLLAEVGLGTALMRLLPAGSVTGAPKKKTVEIIRDAEGRERGYYTGVFGIFDGRGLDSGVMIRFIEKEGGHFYYRSGGGITTQSSCEKEYQEVLEKIYVPVN